MAVLATALPDRSLHVVADAAYAGKELRALPAQVTWTTRLRVDAALYDLAPPRTSRRGRPRSKGARLPGLTALATQLPFTPLPVRRYGQTTTVNIATVRCLWYGTFGPQPVTVILLRETTTHTRGGYDTALVTTDTLTRPAEIIHRYAARWSIEVIIEDAKQLIGVGKARNRLAHAVERTVPFGLTCQTLTMLWYATVGHTPTDVADHRDQAPWYTTKANPSTADMIDKLRRVLIATKYQVTRPDQPTPEEIHTIRLAWELDAA
ncbi:transposase [Frankia sp. Cas3]|uniref:transposase n=1 Tax=Frankia sp. Cas3 TaxID=3073926 RepID=UPI002AD42266|nr:transposase [Frankia sp. Cas3]